MKTISSMLSAFGTILLSATSAQAGSVVDIDQINTTGAVAVVTQTGAHNVANIQQRDGSHSATLTMNGALNTATIRQSGSGSDTLTALSDGIGNRLSVDQTAAAFASNSASVTIRGNDNAASIAQNSLSGLNSASITQTGSGNQATLGQTGSDNLGSLSQVGSGNSLGLSQTGGDNSAALAQTGHGLGLTVTQTGGESITINQTGH